MGHPWRCRWHQPGPAAAGLDSLAQADQVVLVVGVVVGGATPVAQPQADPAPAMVLVAEAADVAADNRDQGRAGGGEQVDALVTPAAAIAGGAPARPDPHWSLDRAHPTTGATSGRSEAREQGWRVDLAELVDQWP